MEECFFSIFNVVGHRNEKIVLVIGTFTAAVKSLTNLYLENNKNVNKSLKNPVFFYLFMRSVCCTASCVNNYLRLRMRGLI